MPPVDIDTLTRLLIKTEREVSELGWNQPDLLFAVHGPDYAPNLEYVLQLPGHASVLLRDLVRTGVRAEPDVLGLVLVTTSPRQLDLGDPLVLPVTSDSLTGDHDAVEERLEQAWALLDGHRMGCDDTPPVRTVGAVQRDGTVIVVTRHAGEHVQVAEYMPGDVPDQQVVTQLVMQMLVGDQVPERRDQFSVRRA